MRRVLAFLTALLFLPIVFAVPAQAAPTVTQPVFAYYYLWWSTQHWQDQLGLNYPYSQSPLPLPATLDSTGCNAQTLYSGNKLTDVSQTLQTQDDPAVIEQDVRDAAAAGLTGFAVNWDGDGTTTQTVASNGKYNQRLQDVVDAVHKVNAEGIPFTLWLSYKSSATVLTVDHITHDLTYINSMYGKDPAFEHQPNGKLTMIFQGSRKYSESALQTVSNAWRWRFRILGDETLASWTTGTRSEWLAGDAYYWSSQDPWKNPSSFGQLQQLASAVRNSGLNQDGTAKVWVAPANPGYNKQLAGGTNCVARQNNGVQTLTQVFQGNAASNPDAWGLISWNEITEGTYVLPLTRYGRQYIDLLHSLTVG